ncbi:MAG: hypothetical protein ABSB32_05030 [Thermodesulfobacteriota bacterium]|jgi:hypothetical protein
MNQFLVLPEIFHGSLVLNSALINDIGVGDKLPGEIEVLVGNQKGDPFLSDF